MELNKLEGIDGQYQAASYNFAFSTMRVRLKWLASSSEESGHIERVVTTPDFKNHKMLIAVKLKSGEEYSVDAYLGLHTMMKGIDDHIDSIWEDVKSMLRVW